MARGGGGADRQSLGSVAARGSGSPEFTVNGALGVESTGGLAGDDRCGMANPLGHSGRGLWVQTGLAMAKGGSARRGFAGVRALALVRSRIRVLGVLRACAEPKHT